MGLGILLLRMSVDWESEMGELGVVNEEKDVIEWVLISPSGKMGNKVEVKDGDSNAVMLVEDIVTAQLNLNWSWSLT